MAESHLPTLPESCVPDAFHHGHLYSPTAGVTTIAFRPGDEYEPMPSEPCGNPQAWALWWKSTAKIPTADFLGLKAGDDITAQHTTPSPGVVVATYRFGALVRYPMPPGANTEYAEMYVRRRNTSGRWY